MEIFRDLKLKLQIRRKEEKKNIMIMIQENSLMVLELNFFTFYALSSLISAIEYWYTINQCLEICLTKSPTSHEQI
jgi:hypothetical protein